MYLITRQAERKAVDEVGRREKGRGRGRRRREQGETEGGRGRNEGREEREGRSERRRGRREEEGREEHLTLNYLQEIQLYTRHTVVQHKAVTLQSPLGCFKGGGRG